MSQRSTTPNFFRTQAPSKGLRARMARAASGLATLALLAGAAQASSTPDTLTTTFQSNNGSSGNMFDITATKTIQVVDLDCNVSGSTGSYDLYTIPGSYVGNENNQNAWTLVSTGSLNAFGQDAPTSLAANLSITIPAGTTLGFYVTFYNGLGIRYTNGTGSAPGTAATNADLTISEGVGVSHAFGSVFSPRVWNGTVHYFGDTGTGFCFGDGTGSFCPCGNMGSGDSGCANSTNYGAAMAGDGTTSVSANDLRFVVSDLPPNRPAMLIAGSMDVNGGLGFSFGDGLSCVGGSIQNFGVQFAGMGGAASWSDSLIQNGSLQAGSSYYFQVVYRDSASGSPCGAMFNLSNGVAVSLQP